MATWGVWVKIGDTLEPLRAAEMRDAHYDFERSRSNRVTTRQGVSNVNLHKISIFRSIAELPSLLWVSLCACQEKIKNNNKNKNKNKKHNNTYLFNTCMKPVGCAGSQIHDPPTIVRFKL